MTSKDAIESLLMIQRGAALRAEIEFELEEMGFITTDDGPYAKLTVAGKTLVATAHDSVAVREP